MNLLQMTTKSVDFERLGFEAMLACGDEEEARNICAQRIVSYAEGLRPKNQRFNSELTDKRHRFGALHQRLYSRPIPVNDAAMLAHSRKCRELAVLAVLAAIACFAGNLTTFFLFGFPLLLTVLLGAAMTALPLVIGHPAYEKIVARNRGLQVLVILTAVALCCGGIYRLGEARRMMVDKAVETTTNSSYVDNGAEDNADKPDSKPQEDSEAKVRHTLGEAMFLIMIAAEIMLGWLVGRLAHMRSDEDHVAWTKLKELTKQIIELEERLAELVASIEIAKKECTAGILRARSILSKHRMPYHRALTTFVLTACLVLVGHHTSEAQTIEHYEGILIDTSGSISKNGTTNELFHEYLISAKRLLLSEPANSRIWVSSIATDSFGGGQEVLKGWTPDSRGVFTDNLNRARRQLASSFEVKSAAMAPVSSGTDIFGGLWHLKALFESSPNTNGTQPVSRTIWIFSDMMNETKDFPMPSLIDMGTEQMLEHAKAQGLLVPLKGYKIYVYGASPSGMTPQTWSTVKSFWTAYFAAAGTELISYSAECDIRQ